MQRNHLTHEKTSPHVWQRWAGVFCETVQCRKPGGFSVSARTEPPGLQVSGGFAHGTSQVVRARATPTTGVSPSRKSY